MPSNFLISLTESIYFPPFQLLVSEKKAAALPPFPELFIDIAADLCSGRYRLPIWVRSASLITSDTSGIMAAPSPYRSVVGSIQTCYR